jgi:hypothetical protein
VGRAGAGRRAAYLKRVAELVRADAERLARIVSLEVGKPMRESRFEIDGWNRGLLRLLRRITIDCRNAAELSGLSSGRQSGGPPLVMPRSTPARRWRGHNGVRKVRKGDRTLAPFV